MADIQFSGIGITAMNGSIGGTTISRNKFGYYAKKRIGAPGVTIWLTAARTQYATFSDVWRYAMTDEERQAWYEVSLPAQDDLAMTHFITGFQLYMELNWNLFLVGGTGITVPPVLIDRPQVSYFRVGLIGSTIVDISISSVSLVRCAIYISKYVSPGRMSNNQIYMYMGYVDLNNVPVNIYPSITTRIGTRVPGNKLFIKCVPISTTSGLRGVRQFASYIAP